MFEQARNLWRRMTHSHGMSGSADVIDPNDRRRAERIAVVATAMCQADAVGLAATSVPLRDISRTGVSFLLDTPLEPGVMVTLDVPTADGDRATILACVRHRTFRPNEGWFIGCSFAAELGDHELAGFGAETSPGPSDDQRRWLRVTPTAGRAVLRQFAETQTGPAVARILNLSPGGLGLVFPLRIEPGTLLDLELLGRADQPGLAILASAVFVAPRGDHQWLIGCNFIRELTAAEMHALI